ncbi:hypothetical protein N7450_003124 [Penicillium hetheringtonii]|uniref:BRCT domain-containing protein n=1 Tax=Penicillium hetheringtonii TaxID=911720 RepID=A0AAD6GWW8_9EURO|nr:hypothetical protein N7450_003124 [Penicillium hetheringtonii]
MNFPLEAAEQLAAVIEENGGEPSIHESSPEQTELIECTHIVSSTINFQSYDYFSNALIPIIKPAWVHTSLSKRKLANPRQHSPDPRLFLNDVVVTCGDIPEGDKDAIIGGVLAKGGLYSSRLSATVTHLVDLTADSDKARVIKAKAMRVKIVLPHWFDDCLKLGQRINEKPYMLPDPEILRAGPEDPIRWNENKNLAGASTPVPRAMPTPNSTPNQLKVFEGKSILLSSDLGIGSHLLQSIEAVLQQSGATVTSNVNDADWVVCRFREGFVYRTASRFDKVVGNLAWLYYLMTFNTYTRPLSRPLHYPISPTPIPGFEKFKISLSNYVGEARIYLENLIAATGAECTKTLRQENTHLITAHGNSEKCNAAREWGLQVVNHLWLEDSYAKWKGQPVSDPRYSHFPLRTNLSDIVGQKMLDPTVLKQVFFSMPVEEQAKPTRAMQSKDQNTEEFLDNEPQNADGGSSETAQTTPRIARKESRRSSDKQTIQTPAPSRLIPENKENETPSSTNSRRSKEAATARLHDYAPDLALYEKERKRVGGVIYGGRRVSDEDRVKIDKNSKKRRSADPQEESDGDQAPEVKRQKRTRPPISMHLLITGYQKWIGKGNEKKEDADKRHLRDLGIMVVQDARRCTHLAAPTILRTTKFVNALAYSPAITSVDFVTSCLEQDKLLDPKDFPLVDKANEAKFKFSLAKAADNAKKNKNKLLKGYRIYCVDDIRGGFEAFKSIVDTNGGECLLFRGRLALASQSRREESDDDENEMEDDEPSQREVFLLSSAEPRHARLWPRFRQLASDIRKTPRIVSVDWLLDMAMSQELRAAEDYEVREDMVQDAEG